MPSAPYNTTFIGDNVLFEYLDTIFKEERLKMDCLESSALKYQSAFCFEGLKIRHIKEAFTATNTPVNYKFRSTVVVMFGTRDILNSTLTANTRWDLMDCLSDLLSYLRISNVEQVVLCTVPPIQRATALQADSVQSYNDFIKKLHNSRFIKVVDVHSALDHGSLFQSNGFIPTAEGYLVMHQLLEEFL